MNSIIIHVRLVGYAMLVCSRRHI